MCGVARRIGGARTNDDSKSFGFGAPISSMFLTPNSSEACASKCGPATTSSSGVSRTRRLRSASPARPGAREIRVRLGETATQEPAAQVFSYDEKSQQMKIGNLCMESWGRGDPQDAVGLGACSSAPDQHWRLVAKGDYHQIIGIRDLCLEPRNAAKENGAPLNIVDCGINRRQQLWTLKAPTRGVLGVRWRRPTEQESSSLGLERGVGIVVEKVLEGGPSEKSGSRRR